MAKRHVIGSVVIAAGLFFMLARQPLAEFQVGLQPRFIRSLKHAVPLSRATFLLMGIALIVVGVFEIAGFWP